MFVVGTWDVLVSHFLPMVSVCFCSVHVKHQFMDENNILGATHVSQFFFLTQVVTLCADSIMPP